MNVGPDSELFAGLLPFVHTATERSFRRAAARLGVSPAAVSKAVRKLEERVGSKLLVRTSRTVSLTPEGAVFFERCRDAVASVQAARELVSESRRGPRGLLHVTLPLILGRHVVPELTRRIAPHPKLSLRVAMTDRLVRLEEEGVDVAVRIGERGGARLVSRLLRRTRWVTVASPGYLARRGVPKHPSGLGQHDCLRFVAPTGRARDWVFRADGAMTNVAVQGSLLIDHGELLLEAAVAGLGVCQLLDFMVKAPIGRGELTEILDGYSAPGPPIYALAAPERSRSPNVRAAFGFLEEIFRAG